jgi:thiol:disulfide interchange protein DsbC
MGWGNLTLSRLSLPACFWDHFSQGISIMRKSFFSRSLALLCVGVLGIALQAHADEASVSKLLKQKFPKLSDTTAVKISEKGVQGLYSVTVNGRVAYVDENVTFIFTNGNLLSAATAENLSLTHQQDANRRLFASLPKDQAFKTVFGKGQRQLVTIEDADCPACKDFVKQLHAYPNPEKLNLTLWTFPYALERIHPDAARKAEAIWCSSSSDAGRSTAWKNWMLGGPLPTATVKGCQPPVRKNIARFTQLGINATPTIMFSDGSALPGGIEASKLIEALDAVQKGVNK